MQLAERRAWYPKGSGSTPTFPRRTYVHFISSLAMCNDAKTRMKIFFNFFLISITSSKKVIRRFRAHAKNTVTDSLGASLEASGAQPTFFLDNSVVHNRKVPIPFGCRNSISDLLQPNH